MFISRMNYPTITNKTRLYHMKQLTVTIRQSTRRSSISKSYKAFVNYRQDELIIAADNIIVDILILITVRNNGRASYTTHF